jgi:hypothetical protein
VSASLSAGFGKVCLEMTFMPGDHVRVIGLPKSMDSLPADAAAMFWAVLGRTLRVDDVDAVTGSLALNVHADGSQADDWCQHTLWLEPESAVQARPPFAPSL